MSNSNIPRYIARKSTVSRSMPSKSLIIVDQSTIEQAIIVLPDIENEQIIDVEDREEIITDLVDDLLNRIENELQLSFQSEMSIENDENSSSTCTCTCHQNLNTMSRSESLDDLLRFEQTLEQTRHEEQLQRSMKNTQLLQLLKDQHEDLMNFYLKQIQIKKIDREQQTSPIEQRHFQGQTDSITPSPSISIPIRSIEQTTSARSFSSTFLTPISTVGPSLQEIIPCMTTISRSLTRPSPMTKSHDIVDLTEDDEDNNETEKQKRQANPTSTTSILSSATAAARPNAPYQIPILFNHPSCDQSVGRPQLTVSQDSTTVHLTWNLLSTPIDSIQHYEIFASKRSSNLVLSDWKKIGCIKSMRLPIAVSLKEFQQNSHYAFAIRAVSIDNRFGPFSEAKMIFTSPNPNPTQPLQTSHLLNQF